MNVKIRKATKKDFQEYLPLKKKDTKKHSMIIKEKARMLSNQEFRDDFNKILSSKKRNLLLAQEDGKIIGFIIVNAFKNIWEKGGYIDDIFVLKEYRGKGIASLMIKEFIKILKTKKLYKLYLDVSIRNKIAMNLYKKLGFKLCYYQMKKNLK